MEFRVLGPLEVLGDSGPIPLGGKKQRAVLAHLLARSNRVVSNDELIDALWPDEPPNLPRASIQTYVSNLRRVLGNERIATRAPGYVLVLEPDELDALKFETLVRDGRRVAVADQARAMAALDSALSLWRGAAYGDLVDDPRLQAEATRLEHLRLTAFEERMEALLAAGRNVEVANELETLTREHPTRERLWRQLMLALYRSDRRGDAFEIYLKARRAIVDALGVEPSPDLQRLHSRMLKHDPSLNLAGRPIRGYVLVEQMGQGAFGTVHRAVQPEVGRDVAIKVVHDRFATDPAFIERFEREAQVIARLEHPHIVPLYDYWRDPSGAYLVMRHMRGGNLDHLLRSTGPFTADAAIRVVEDVAAALDFAHRQGVIHRDVRPPNVLFDEDGAAYLSDFGIAKEVAAAIGSSAVSPDAGYYLSPEEIQGGRMTPAADIYSLGLLMFEVLAGRHPYADTPASEIRARHLGAVPSLVAIRADLPPEVDVVIGRATARAPGDRFEDAASLALALRTALGAQPRLETAVVGIDVRNPYKGLRPFEESDAPDYFGRATFVSRLVERLAERAPGSKFLAVVGPSGSGKSSLVQAGLLPALRAGRVNGSQRWHPVAMHPGADPFAEFEAAMGLDGTQRDVNEIVGAARHVLPAGDSELLLIIDQFEELFSLVEDEDVRGRFLRCLHTAVSDPDGRVRIVITLRADFYDRPLLYRDFGDLLAERTQVVTPLSIEELEEAIRRPAHSVGVEVEPTVVAAIVAEAGDQPVLPLVQYTLTELLEHREGGRLTMGAFRSIGGVSGAIGLRADDIYSRLDEKQREAARQIFLRLITLGDDGLPETRRRVLQRELAEMELAAPDVAAVLDLFGAHRLMTFDRDPSTRGPTVEVAHEALLREWSRLRGWIDSALEDVRAHRRLVASAREWAAADREPSFLLAGAKLEQMETSLATSTVTLTTSERSYLDASVERREVELGRVRAGKAREAALQRRSRDRLRALVAILAIATIVASGLSLFALNQQGAALRQARLATARELTAAAQANLALDPERSMLLALRAIETTRSDGVVLPEAEELLHRALNAAKVQRTIPGAGTLVSWGSPGDRIALARQGDGKIDLRRATSGELLASWQTGADSTYAIETLSNGEVITSAGDGAVRLWDPNTGQSVRVFTDTPQEVWGLSASADSTLLAGLWWDPVTESSQADVFNVRSGQIVLTIRNLESPLHEAARTTSLSPDGRLIAVARALPELEIYEVATGRLVRRLAGGDVFRVNEVAWSPDGKRLVTVSQEFVRIWDAASGVLLATLLGHTSAVVDVDWSADGRRIVTASDDGTVRVWDSDPHGGALPQVLAGHDVGVARLALNPKGDRVVSVGVDGTAKVWNLGFEADAEWMNLVTDPLWYSDVTFTPDGSHMLGSDLNGKVKIWDAGTGTVIRTLDGHGGPSGLGGTAAVATISVSADGSLIATGGRDMLVKIWRASTGELIRTYEGHRGWVEDVRFSSDGRLLLSAGQDRTARVIEMATGRELLVLNLGWPGLAAWFGPNDRTVIAGGDFRDNADPTPIKIFDYSSGALRSSIRTDGILHSLTLNRARTMAAAGFVDGTARVWDLSSGRQVASMKGHTAGIFAIAFSPDGRRLASGSDNGEVKLWDVPTGKNTLSLPGHTGPVGQVIFSPDGSRLASSGGDGKIRVWALDLDDLIAIAKLKLTRSFTTAECQQYLHQNRCSQ